MEKSSKTNINRKEHILNAAKKEFAEKGFEGARMDSIARRAGVNKALLHYHYSNKENLYKEVLKQETLIVSEIMDKFRNLTPDTLTPPEKLYLGIYALIDLHFESMSNDYRKIVSREMSMERDNFKHLIRDHLIPQHEAFEKIIIEGVEQGYFLTKNPLFVVIGLNTFIMNYVNSMYLLDGTSWYDRLFGEKHKQELLDFLLDHTFKALQPVDVNFKIPVLSDEVKKAISTVVKEVRKSHE